MYIPVQLVLLTSRNGLSILIITSPALSVVNAVLDSSL